MRSNHPPPPTRNTEDGEVGQMDVRMTADRKGDSLRAL
jgi:hypothetical protein